MSTLSDAVDAAQQLVLATWPDLNLGETSRDDTVTTALGSGRPTIECHWTPGDERDPAQCWGPVDHNGSSWVVGGAVEAMRVALRFEANDLDVASVEPDEDGNPEHMRADAAELRRMALVSSPSGLQAKLAREPSRLEHQRPHRVRRERRVPRREGRPAGREPR